VRVDAVRRGAQCEAGAEVARPPLGAFTLATYVHLLDGDIGEPLAVPQGANNVRTAPTPDDTGEAVNIEANLAA
jgi:hypothetical protein